jgi:hypothetical protein
VFYISAVVAGFMQSNVKKIKSIPSKVYRVMANWWDTYQDHSCKWQRGRREDITQLYSFG